MYIACILLLLVLTVTVFMVFITNKQKSNSDNSNSYVALTMASVDKYLNKEEAINKICKIIDKDYNEVKSMFDFYYSNNHYDENFDKSFEPIVAITYEGRKGLDKLKIIRDKINTATSIKCALIVDEEILHDDKFNIDYIVETF